MVEKDRKLKALVKETQKSKLDIGKLKAQFDRQTTLLKRRNDELSSAKKQLSSERRVRQDSSRRQAWQKISRNNGLTRRKSNAVRREKRSKLGIDHLHALSGSDKGWLSDSAVAVTVGASQVLSRLQTRLDREIESAVKIRKDISRQQDLYGAFAKEDRCDGRTQGASSGHFGPDLFKKVPIHRLDYCKAILVELASRFVQLKIESKRLEQGRRAGPGSLVRSASARDGVEHSLGKGRKARKSSSDGMPAPSATERKGDAGSLIPTPGQRSHRERKVSPTFPRPLGDRRSSVEGPASIGTHLFDLEVEKSGGIDVDSPHREDFEVEGDAEDGKSTKKASNLGSGSKLDIFSRLFQTHTSTSMSTQKQSLQKREALVNSPKKSVLVKRNLKSSIVPGVADGPRQSSREELIDFGDKDKIREGEAAGSVQSAKAKDSVFSRLTDSSRYTGSHRSRHDKSTGGKSHARNLSASSIGSIGSKMKGNRSRSKENDRSKPADDAKKEEKEPESSITQESGNADEEHESEKAAIGCSTPEKDRGDSTNVAHSSFAVGSAEKMGSSALWAPDVEGLDIADFQITHENPLVPKFDGLESYVNRADSDDEHPRPLSPMNLHLRVINSTPCQSITKSQYDPQDSAGDESTRTPVSLFGSNEPQERDTEAPDDGVVNQVMRSWIHIIET